MLNYLHGFNIIKILSTGKKGDRTVGTRKKYGDKTNGVIGTHRSIHEQPLRTK